MPHINRTYAVAQMSSFAAVRYLLFVFRFCALRAQKRNTDTMASTMLPYILSLTKGRLKDVCVRHRVSPVVKGHSTSFERALLYHSIILVGTWIVDQALDRNKCSTIMTSQPGSERVDQDLLQ